MGFLERAPHRAAAGADTYVALIVAAPATKDFRESRRRHRRFFGGRTLRAASCRHRRIECDMLLQNNGCHEDR